MAMRTKQEHYVPNKSYLDYFVDKSDNLLWTYHDRSNFLIDISKADERKINPTNFCKEAYFYEAPIYPVNAIEKALSTIERKYKHILENKILKKEKLTPEDKEVIAYFISSLEARTTAGKDNVNSFINSISDHFSALERQYSQGERTPNHKALLKLKEENTAFAQSVAISMQVNRWRLSDFLFMNIVYDGDDQFFISSDNPVSLCDFTLMNGFYGIPPLSITAEVTIPLTPNIALFINNNGFNGYEDISPNFVREINNRTLLLANNYLISSKQLNRRFIQSCTRRFRQSFILHMLQEKLEKEWSIRHKKRSKNVQRVDK